VSENKFFKHQMEEKKNFRFGGISSGLMYFSFNMGPRGRRNQKRAVPNKARCQNGYACCI